RRRPLHRPDVRDRPAACAGIRGWSGRRRRRALWPSGVSMRPIRDAGTGVHPNGLRPLRASPRVRKTPEVQLHQQLAAIVHCSHDAIISKTLDGVITTWNDAASQLYGYSADEVVGQHAELLYPTTRRQEETRILQQISRGERIDQYVTERIHRD